MGVHRKFTDTMKLYIKNMVCSRCKMVVKTQLENKGLHPLSVNLGEVEIEDDLSKDQLLQLDTALKALGFELIDNKKSQTIEKIKNAVITLVHHSDNDIHTNLSAFITSKIHQDYNYLSNLFSEVEGTTIEKYFISQRIEKAKELLVYDELTLSEIADRLGYSSVAYLSNQFKKITGFTPSYFKSLKEHKRKNIEEL
ncbi:MAG: AraC family transcriptional regulator [Flavisolibacter sp.]|jgi:YesN/AraC family two-component response regulator|nr:AraC family transcriptional regulator [Flavisolibacter sp.]